MLVPEITCTMNVVYICRFKGSAVVDSWMPTIGKEGPPSELDLFFMWRF